MLKRTTKDQTDADEYKDGQGDRLRSHPKPLLIRAEHSAAVGCFHPSWSELHVQVVDSIRTHEAHDTDGHGHDAPDHAHHPHAETVGRRFVASSWTTDDSRTDDRRVTVAVMSTGGGHAVSVGTMLWIAGAGVLGFDLVWGIGIYSAARSDLSGVRRWGRPLTMALLVLGVVLVVTGIIVQVT